MKLRVSKNLYKKIVEDRVRSQNWVIRGNCFTFLGENYVKSHLIKLSHRVLRKTKVEIPIKH